MPKFSSFFFEEEKPEKVDVVTVLIDKHLDCSENSLNRMLEIAKRNSAKIDAKHITDLELQDNPRDAAENIYKSLLTEQQAQRLALKPKYKKMCLESVGCMLAMGATMTGAGAWAGFLGWALFVGGQSASASIQAVTIGAEVGGALGTTMGIWNSVDVVRDDLKSNSFIAYRTLKSDLLEFQKHFDEFFAFPVHDQATENRSLSFNR